MEENKLELEDLQKENLKLKRDLAIERELNNRLSDSLQEANRELISLESNYNELIAALRAQAKQNEDDSPVEAESEN